MKCIVLHNIVSSLRSHFDFWRLYMYSVLPSFRPVPVSGQKKNYIGFFRWDFQFSSTEAYWRKYEHFRYKLMVLAGFLDCDHGFNFSRKTLLEFLYLNSTEWDLSLKKKKKKRTYRGLQYFKHEILRELWLVKTCVLLYQQTPASWHHSTMRKEKEMPNHMTKTEYLIFINDRDANYWRWITKKIVPAHRRWKTRVSAFTRLAC